MYGLIGGAIHLTEYVKMNILNYCFTFKSGLFSSNYTVYIT